MKGTPDISDLCAQFSEEALQEAERAAQLLRADPPGAHPQEPEVLNGSISVGGRPLRFFYVEFNGRYYQTDAAGRVWIPTSASSARVKVWAANDAVRVLNGMKFNLAYTQDVTVGQTGDTPIVDENHAFSLALKFREVLEDYRRVFPFWATMGFDFPTDRRIEVSWPDRSPATISFNEPTAATGYPLIHLKALPPYVPPDDATLWHEFGHALHFAEIPHAVRDFFKWHYLGYILSHLDDPYHDYPIPTDETVAWIEAWGDFCGGDSSGRFRPCDPSFVPSGDGSVVEGAIANLLFIGMKAAGWGADQVAESYIRSGARTIREYAGYLGGVSPAMRADLAAQGPNWKITV